MTVTLKTRSKLPFSYGRLGSGPMTSKRPAGKLARALSTRSSRASIPTKRVFSGSKLEAQRPAPPSRTSSMAASSLRAAANRGSSTAAWARWSLSASVLSEASVIVAQVPPFQSPEVLLGPEIPAERAICQASQQQDEVLLRALGLGQPGSELGGGALGLSEPALGVFEPVSQLLDLLCYEFGSEEARLHGQELVLHPQGVYVCRRVEVVLWQPIPPLDRNLPRELLRLFAQLLQRLPGRFEAGDQGPLRYRLPTRPLLDGRGIQHLGDRYFVQAEV